MKKLSNLKDAKILSKVEQKNISGNGGAISCPLPDGTTQWCAPTEGPVHCDPIGGCTEPNNT